MLHHFINHGCSVTLPKSQTNSIQVNQTLKPRFFLPHYTTSHLCPMVQSYHLVPLRYFASMDLRLRETDKRAAMGQHSTIHSFRNTFKVHTFLIVVAPTYKIIHASLLKLHLRMLWVHAGHFSKVTMAEILSSDVR